MIAVCLVSIPAQAQYGGGTGEPNDPYLIYTAEQMNEIGLHEEDWNKHFKLMADVDLAGFTGTDFNIIGRYSWHFNGVFDGNGHRISNFTYDSNDKDYIGLFGYIRGEIKDLGLIDPNVDGGTGGNVGSLVGTNYGTTTNCYVEGGSVSGNDYVGGLVGYNDGTITNSYSTGSVTGTRDVGGLVGALSWWGTITNCYSASEVSGNDYVGGLVGDNGGYVIHCYSTGEVSGEGSVGGLVGDNGFYSSVFNSFWDIETSGQTTSDGGTGKTTAEMQMASTFIYWSVRSDELIWTIDEGNDYPRLWWEDKPGEAIKPISLSDFLLGTGTMDDPYLIYTPEELNLIGLGLCDWDKHFKLMADIDLSGFDGKDGRRKK